MQYEHTCDLVQCEAFVVFKQDAADTPHVTRVTPPQLWGLERRDTFLKNTAQDWQLLVTPWSKSTSLTQDDLWSSVVTSGDDDRVVFVVKGGAAKVNEPHRGVIYSPLIALLEEEEERRNSTWLFKG